MLSAQSGPVHPLGAVYFGDTPWNFLFLRSREKIPTLTSHREGPFRNLDFRISQNNHISPCFASYDLGFSPICPRRPGEGWEPSGGGFAPLHRPFGRPAFFVVGPRVTEVSLSGSSRRLNYSVFKVLCWSLVKAYQRFFLSGSDWEYTIWCTLSTPFCESAHYNDNLGSSLTGVTICHSLL